LWWSPQKRAFEVMVDVAAIMEKSPKKSLRRLNLARKY
jgi:hypothetical protein